MGETNSGMIQEGQECVDAHFLLFPRGHVLHEEFGLIQQRELIRSHKYRISQLLPRNVLQRLLYAPCSLAVHGLHVPVSNDLLMSATPLSHIRNPNTALEHVSVRFISQQHNLLLTLRTHTHSNTTQL